MPEPKTVPLQGLFHKSYQPRTDQSPRLYPTVQEEREFKEGVRMFLMQKGTVAYEIEVGTEVVYIDGEGQRHRERVTVVWEGWDPPLVNLTNGKTSVPHKNHVSKSYSGPATGNYYMLEL